MVASADDWRVVGPPQSNVIEHDEAPTTSTSANTERKTI